MGSSWNQETEVPDPARGVHISVRHHGQPRTASSVWVPSSATRNHVGTYDISSDWGLWPAFARALHRCTPQTTCRSARCRCPGQETNDPEVIVDSLTSGLYTYYVRRSEARQHTPKSQYFDRHCGVEHRQQSQEFHDMNSCTPASKSVGLAAQVSFGGCWLEPVGMSKAARCRV